MSAPVGGCGTDGISATSSVVGGGGGEVIGCCVVLEVREIPGWISSKS